MRHLILPDVHNRWEKAEKIIKSVKPDKTIFLGDVFDDFGDDPNIIVDVADWFHHSINQKDRIHICGNHELHYWFKDNKFLRCSGYEQFKSIAINDIVTKQDWEKLVFFHILDGKWLLSHAGVHPSWMSPSQFKCDQISQYALSTIKTRLTNETVSAKKKFYRGDVHWFGIPGFTRDRSSPYYGGLTWCDWSHEFHPIRGINQIVGHTPTRDLTWIIIPEGGTEFSSLPLNKVSNPTLSEKASYNVCIDSIPGLRYFAIYEDGMMTIQEDTVF